MSSELMEARAVERENRFVVRAETEAGDEVRAYLPNTARLVGLLVPGVRLLLAPVDDPSRKTRFTVHRIYDGPHPVSIQADRANDLLEEWLKAGGALPGLGAVEGWEREVALGRHRIDFRLRLAGGDAVSSGRTVSRERTVSSERTVSGESTAWLEVKSLSMVVAGAARFSRTPSTRGAAHLDALARLAEQGVPAACAFVVQHPAARRLAADADADPGWLAALRDAVGRGVRLLGFGCEVTREGVWIAQVIPVEV